MKTILFNVHDLALVAVLGLSVLLALACISISGRSRQLLAAFFVINGIVALDTLVYWGDGVKYAAFEISPWLLLTFSFAAFAFGPVLLWLVRSEVLAPSKRSKLFLLHLLPAIVTPLYLYWVCYRYPLEIQRDLLLNLTLYSIPAAHFATFIALKYLSPAIYAVFSLRLLYVHLRARDQLDNPLRQLFRLTAGFAIIKGWMLLTHLSGLWLPQLPIDLMGIVGNYLTLSLLIGLIVLSVQQQGKAEVEAHQQAPVRSEEVNAIRLSEEIEQFMRQERPYLNPHLNLERFAQQFNVSPRRASVAINRGCGQTFQDYINRARVEEAKRLLVSLGNADLPMAEIARLAGFNSKATFNRIFKTQEALTPSAYRQKFLHHLPDSAANMEG